MAGWKRLAKATADGTSSTLSVSFDANDVIRLQVYAENTSGAGNFQIRFNNDTTANRHKTRRVYDGAGSGSDRYADTSSNKFISYSATSALQSFMVIDVFNMDNEEHLVMGNCVESGATGAGSSGVPHTVNWMGKYTEKTPQVTSVQLITNSNNLNDKSYIIVLTTADNVVSDEKQTLADATITESATASPSTLDSTNGVTSWTEAGSMYTIDSSNNQIDFALVRNNSGSSATTALYDLGSGTMLNDTKFVLRFRLNIGTITNPSNSYSVQFNFGAFSSTSDMSTAEDHLGIFCQATSNTGNNWNFGVGDNAASYSQSPQVAFDASGTGVTGSNNWYVEIVRESASAGKCRLYSDSTYETLVQEKSLSFSSSNPQNLRYIGSKCYGSNANASATYNGYLSDVKVYNGVTTVDTTVSIAPNNGTQYRETNTRKIYRWNDNKNITNGLKALYEWSNSGDVSNTATGSDSIGSAGNLSATSGAAHSTSVKKIGTASGHFPNDSSYSKTSTSNGANFDFTGDSTVTVWVRRIDGLDSDYHAMVSKRSGSSSEYNLYLSPVSSGVSKAYVYITAGGSTTNVATDSGIPDSTWTHIAVTISGSVLKFYINGSLDATRDVTSGSKGTISQPFGLGAISGSGTEGFQGYLDQVSIWNRALTAGEVSKIYNGGDGVADLNALTDKGWVVRGTA